MFNKTGWESKCPLFSGQLARFEARLAKLGLKLIAIKQIKALGNAQKFGKVIYGSNIAKRIRAINSIGAAIPFTIFLVL